MVRDQSKVRGPVVRTSSPNGPDLKFSELNLSLICKEQGSAKTIWPLFGAILVTLLALVQSYISYTLSFRLSIWQSP